MAAINKSRRSLGTRIAAVNNNHVKRGCTAFTNLVFASDNNMSFLVKQRRVVELVVVFLHAWNSISCEDPVVLVHTETDFLSTGSFVQGKFSSAIYSVCFFKAMRRTNLKSISIRVMEKRSEIAFIRRIENNKAKPKKTSLG